MSHDHSKPAWMTGTQSEPVARGDRTQAQSYVKTDLTHLPRPASRNSETFPQSVITGVKIIAGLMLLNTTTVVAFFITTLFPPKANAYTGSTLFGDYFSPWRLLATLVIGVALAIGVWLVVAASE